MDPNVEKKKRICGMNVHYNELYHILDHSVFLLLINQKIIIFFFIFLIFK
jgi:hypothetical protein